MKKFKGTFITFEGPDGSGKSTQAERIFKDVRKRCPGSVLIREPGGTKISERIRRILLDGKLQSITRETELLLFTASRAQIVTQVIIPKLQAGKVVICDRFSDATYAYQGYGNGDDMSLIKKINCYASKNLRPNLTILMDIDPKTGLDRARKISNCQDRMESKTLAFHRRVRQGYLSLAKKEPRRIFVYDGKRSIEENYKIIAEKVNRVIEKSFRGKF